MIALLIVMALCLGAIGARLVVLQGIGGREYAAKGLSDRLNTTTLAAERGSIFDRNGADLALSVPQQTVYGDPHVLRPKDPARYAAKLAPILGVGVGTLRAQLSKHDLSFVYLARKVDDATVRKVRKLDLPGIGFVPESKRFYPASSLAGPLLGFVGVDNQGLGGLEAQFDTALKGRPGEIVAEADPQGREIPATQRRDTPARRGKDLVLTVDQSLQYETERRLVEEVNQTGAKGGMAVIADVQTGDVLAMASVDGANGAAAAGPSSNSGQNRPLTTVYEPGSTNKVITMAAGMEAGLISPGTTFMVPDRLRIADATFEDHDPHGVTRWSVADILRESSNVGTIMIAKLVGKDRLDQYLRAFGFGQKTAIDFPGESAGLLIPTDRWSDTSMGSVPVGNGLAVTAMQMLDVFVTIANGGVTRPPRLVAATIDADGTRHDAPREAGHRVISTGTADALRQMLAGVVNDGTGTLAAVPGYTVAGKTGTARKPPYEHPPYKYMASFAGFAPAENPRLAAIVVLDEPSSEIYGGRVAAPVFSKVMSYALRLERVPPTIPLTQGRPSGSGEVTSNDAPAPTTTTTTTPPPATVPTTAAATVAASPSSKPGG